MSNIIKMPLPDKIGRGCPKCGRYSMILNIGRAHWAYCDVHRFRWCIGSNLFSSWHEQTEDDWAKNAQFLSRFTDAACWRNRSNGGGVA